MYQRRPPAAGVDCPRLCDGDDDEMAHAYGQGYATLRTPNRTTDRIAFAQTGGGRLLCLATYRSTYPALESLTPLLSSATTGPVFPALWALAAVANFSHICTVLDLGFAAIANRE